MNDVMRDKPTSEGLDVMAAVLPHLVTILQDADYNRLKDRVRNDSELTISDILVDAFSLVAVKNRAALYGIVSAVTGKTLEEIGRMPLEETLSVFQGAMGSKVLDFFTFCARMAVRM